MLEAEGHTIIENGRHESVAEHSWMMTLMIMGMLGGVDLDEFEKQNEC